MIARDNIKNTYKIIKNIKTGEFGKLLNVADLENAMEFWKDVKFKSNLYCFSL